MNDNTSNKLDMAKACITLVEKPESIIIWQGQPPLDFAADFSRMKQTYIGLRDLAIAADTNNTGDADAKADAEDNLEKLALQLAAALRNHFKKTGNTSDRAKVTFPKRALVGRIHLQHPPRVASLWGESRCIRPKALVSFPSHKPPARL